MKWLPGPEAIFVGGALVLAPIVLARFVVWGSWAQVACGFFAWYLCLYLVLGGPSLTKGEGIGWVMIMGMFFSWAGVPLFTLGMRLANVPERFF